MLAIHDTSKSESIFKKKCNAIDYLATNRSMAMGESLTQQIRSEDNPAALLTKVVTRQQSNHVVSLGLYDIYDMDTK